MLGGEIDWKGIDVVAEYIGVNDVHHLIAMLITIRDFYRAR